ncbi:glucokinase [Erythrobacter sp.]|jgi:glucokinase|uniref:glucokinase n=1 Tax=Erythrobacter sp. TaxID=1042 RepID=UPI002EA499FA|nr:glucokinase [Erythrobacter sp.]
MNEGTPGPASPLAIADIGGTHARFAHAQFGSAGEIELSDPVILETGAYSTFGEAWSAYCERVPSMHFQQAAFALAGPAGRGRFKLTNGDWHFDADEMRRDLRLSELLLLNDFAAVAHAVAALAGGEGLVHIAGPRQPLPRAKTVSVIGPGTGLGVAHFRWHEGRALVQATEGAHIDFAPVNEIDDRILALLRARHERVSLERVISGDGIAAIYAALGSNEGNARLDDAPEPLEIWRSGMAGDDQLAARALAHFVATLGRVAGDYALAHGAGGVAIAGGLGLRLRAQLAAPAFHEGFTAKGRYRAMMETVPIKLVTHPQPGLLGAAQAFFSEMPMDGSAP